MDEKVSTEPQTAPGDICQAIGSAIIGLYYLSSEAKKDNIEELKCIIDRALVRAIELGCNIYDYKLKNEFEAGLHTLVNEGIIFIDRYCAITDPKEKMKLATIIKNAARLDHCPQAQKS